MKHWLSNEFTISKRLLGLLMILAGIVALAGVLAFNFVEGGEFGPTQQLALGVIVLAIVIGMTLLPLGNRPA